MYDYVWLCMINYDCVWLCMIMHDYVWLCIILYDYVWLCMIMYDYVWLCMIMYDYVCTYVRMYIRMYEYPWQYLRPLNSAPCATLPTTAFNPKKHPASTAATSGSFRGLLFPIIWSNGTCISDLPQQIVNTPKPKAFSSEHLLDCQIPSVPSIGSIKHHLRKYANIACIYIYMLSYIVYVYALIHQHINILTYWYIKTYSPINIL